MGLLNFFTQHQEPNGDDGDIMEDEGKNDSTWRTLNARLIEHARRGDWGLYRSARFEMAEILRKEMKFDQALRTYLEVCYLDLNGPNNTGGINNRELLKEFPPFDPEKTAFLAPGVINVVKRMMKKSELSEDMVMSIFIEHNSRVERSLKLPLSPDECWSPLKKELWLLIKSPVAKQILFQ